jgi:hypothetical protein
MDELFACISGLAPEDALSRITLVLERLLADLDQDARKRFLMNLLNQSASDKVAGLVHL